MRVLTILAASCLTAGATMATAQSVGERPLNASRTYQTCKAAAGSLADERPCLAAELAWSEAALRIVVQQEGVEPESQALWRASVDHDCGGEERAAGEGNSGLDRKIACLIEQTYDRADYLQRRGRW